MAKVMFTNASNEEDHKLKMTPSRRKVKTSETRERAKTTVNSGHFVLLQNPKAAHALGLDHQVQVFLSKTLCL